MTDQVSQIINVPVLLFSIAWIVGFALIVAAISIEYTNAQVEKLSFRAKLSQNRFQTILWTGLIMVSIGFAGNSSGFVERIVWLILLAASGYLVFSSFTAYRREQSPA